MNLTVALTGMLPAIVLIAAVLTALTSAWLLWLYRRAVLRAMGTAAGAVAAPASARLADPPPMSSPAPLHAAPVESGPSADPEAPGLYHHAARSLRRAACVYTAAGLAYAVVLATPWMVFSEGGFLPGRFLWLTACYAWPTVLALMLLAATGRGEGVALVGGYVALLTAIGLYGLSRSPDLTVGQLATFWLFANGPETLLLLAFLNRRVRAVGPLVLAFMVTGVTGAFLFIELAGHSDSLLRAIVATGRAVGLGATAQFALMHVIGFGVFAALGWWLLRWVGGRYERKRLSDQTLTLDALWLVFGVVQSITLVFEGWAWIFTGVAAFAAYKLVASVGFALWRRPLPAPPAAPMLLLLRVFSLGRRSERLFDALSKRWLRAGSISLIAGPDLVTTVVEPHEFLEFMGGRLSRRFVQGEADLERRLSALDTRPDPDGRYRVNEFFCHADTWQPTMRKLACASKAVLMDLRSFSRANQGCQYELAELLAAVPLGRIVFVVDDSTDRPFLEQTFQDLWQRLPAVSPNRALTPAAVRLFEAREPSARRTRQLLQLLFAGGRAELAA